MVYNFIFVFFVDFINFKWLELVFIVDLFLKEIDFDWLLNLIVVIED